MSVFTSDIDTAKIYVQFLTGQEPLAQCTVSGLETISKQVARRRWAWLGHVLRMDHHSHPRIALTWVPEGKRKRGRPREKDYRKRVEREWFRNMGSSSIGCRGQNSLEAESLQPNSPLGEWINDDDSFIKVLIW